MSPKPYEKKPLTYDEQLGLLGERGMLVEDRPRALKALQRISYYRLSAYWYPFRRTGNTFEPGASFETALGLYEYDRRLRLAVLDAIERVEVHARTIITYELAHAFGAFAHCAASNFRPAFDHAGWHQDHEEEIWRAREAFIEHFRATYDSFPDVPLWMASEVMSLGSLSRMYSGLRSAEQDALAGSWGVHRTVAASWFHALSYVRNTCAHHSRLWNRELAIKPVLPVNERVWVGLSNARIYAVLCILREITRTDHGGEGWAAAARGLLREMDSQPRWQKAMGIPGDWASTRFWR